MTGAAMDEVAPGIFVATSRFCLTTTTVVTAGRHVLVVDPAAYPDELDTLARSLQDAGLAVELAFATHWHWDHVLWSRTLGVAPRLASAATAGRATADRQRLVAELPAGERYDVELVGRLVPVTGRVLDWSGPRAELVMHDAHAEGHTALWFPDQRVVVAGDMLSDVEVPLPDWDAPDALDRYHAGLDALDALGPVNVVVPGHGHPGDGASFTTRVDADRRYLDALATGRPADDPRLSDPTIGVLHAENVARSRR
jgi:hydroxyacylglutathione hydrolase